jgi:hypothetical protein
LLFNFASVMPSARSKETKRDWTEWDIPVSGDVNLVGKIINSIKEDKQALLYASVEDGLEVNVEKTKYAFVSCCQTARWIYNMKAANKCSESVSKLKYLGAITKWYS